MHSTGWKIGNGRKFVMSNSIFVCSRHLSSYKAHLSSYKAHKYDRTNLNELFFFKPTRSNESNRIRHYLHAMRKKVVNGQERWGFESRDS